MIAGTALGLMNNSGCGNGILGGILGGGNNCNDKCYVNEKELNLTIALTEARSQATSLAIAREEDAKIAAVVKDTTSALIETGTALARVNEQVKCLQIEVDRNRQDVARDLRESKEYTDCRVNAEAAARQAADQNILAYTNGELAKKISGELVIDGSQIAWGGCKPVLQHCPCGSEQNPFYVKEIASAVVSMMQGK